MSQIFTGVVRNYSSMSNTGIATKADYVPVIFYRKDRAYVSDQLTIVSYGSYPQEHPVKGDRIYFTQETSPLGLPKARWWYSEAEYLRPIWASLPQHDLRIMEQVNDDPASVLWTGTLPKDAIRYLFNRAWYSAPIVDNVSCHDFGNGITIRGWWEERQWDGEWATIPNPLRQSFVPTPDPEPVLVS